MKLGNLQVSFSHINSETTICTVASVNRISTGIATKGTNDLFNKDFGRKLALKRALNSLKTTKEQRTKVWNDYRNMPKTPRW